MLGASMPFRGFTLPAFYTATTYACHCTTTTTGLAIVVQAAREHSVVRASFALPVQADNAARFVAERGSLWSITCSWTLPSPPLPPPTIPATDTTYTTVTTCTTFLPPHRTATMGSGFAAAPRHPLKGVSRRCLPYAITAPTRICQTALSTPCLQFPASHALRRSARMAVVAVNAWQVGACLPACHCHLVYTKPYLLDALLLPATAHAHTCWTQTVDCEQQLLGCWVGNIIN